MHRDLPGTISDLTITNGAIVDTIVLDDYRSLHGSRLQMIGSYATILGSATPQRWVL